MEESHARWRRQRLWSRPGQSRGRGLRAGAHRPARQNRATERGGGFPAKKVQTARSVRERIELVEKDHPDLSVRRQCGLLQVARSSVDYAPVPESAEDQRAKRILDETYLADPCLGSRRLVTILERDHGLALNRKHVQRLRREMGLEAIYCRPRTSVASPQHRKYPYLLRDLTIARPDEVWC